MKTRSLALTVSRPKGDKSAADNRRTGPPSSRPIVPRMPPGPRRLASIEAGALAAAEQLRPAEVNGFLCALIVYVWILISKVETPRGQSGALQKQLAAYESVGGRRAQDLGCRMLLKALHEAAVLQTADRMAYRRDSGPLHRITEVHLCAIAEKYGSLRALMRRFANKAPRAPEDRFVDQLAALRRLLENNPGMELPSSAFEEFHQVEALLKQARKDPAAAVPRAGTRVKRSAPKESAKSARRYRNHRNSLHS